ncbi:PREDICTED: uncharacterized protein LOC108560975 [Nicrophorus vespilloides]|uniref:Uncharacterized protein LOC108560975 n=1 Tax=Nicrophorus vespilloides TaxID=110193 RepID=A0ABM1MI03_NICVS|nr:PREDICTED: uncharacterized protein LOC108560975 [Nicrophorus vespilloides]
MDRFHRITFILLIFTSVSVFGVKITKFYVPGGATNEAPIECSYDLEEDQLYDVKWYKDGSQFFRCLPSGDIVQFEVEGVSVIDRYAKLGSCSLTLNMLTKKSAGEYKCEVSTEAPTFKTAVASAKLRIIEYARRTQTVLEEPSDPEETTEDEPRNIAASNSFKIIPLLAFVLLTNIIC